jgi:hypothetical protein
VDGVDNPPMLVMKKGAIGGDRTVVVVLVVDVDVAITCRGGFK